MWSWVQKDADHRTELLEAFTNADAVSEDTSKGQTNPEGEAKQEVCDMWQSAADGLCIHQVFVFAVYMSLTIRLSLLHFWSLHLSFLKSVLGVFSSYSYNK